MLAIIGGIIQSIAIVILIVALYKTHKAYQLQLDNNEVLAGKLSEVEKKYKEVIDVKGLRDFLDGRGSLKGWALPPVSPDKLNSTYAMERITDRLRSYELTEAQGYVLLTWILSYGLTDNLQREVASLVIKRTRREFKL